MSEMSRKQAARRLQQVSERSRRINKLVTEATSAREMGVAEEVIIEGLRQNGVSNEDVQEVLRGVRGYQEAEEQDKFFEDAVRSASVGIFGFVYPFRLFRMLAFLAKKALRRW